SSVSRSPGIAPEASGFASSSHWQDSDDSDRAHHLQELVGELEGDLLCAGRGLAGELVQGSGEIAAGQPIERHERWGQRTAVVEEVVDRPADAELIAGEGREWRGGRILRRRRQPRYRWQGDRPPPENTIANELRPQVELYAVVEIIQPGPEVARQAECLQILESARAPVIGRQNCVAAREIDAWETDGRDGAVQRGAAAHIHPRSRLRVHLHDIESVALNCEIAGDGHCPGRVAGNEEAAGIDDGRAHGAAAEEHSAAIYSGQAR